MANLLFFVLFSLCLITNGCQDAARLQKDEFSRRLQTLHNPSADQILVAAHRAFHIKYPENSLAAIRHSIENGIDMIEIDVRQTADGVLVLMHDVSVERTTNGIGKVRDLAYDQIKKLNLKNLDGDDLQHPVPSLREVLEFTKNKILIDIDIKDAPVKKLVDLVRQTGTADQVLFFQHHNVTHDSVLTMDKNLMVVPRAETTDQVLQFLAHYQPVVIQIPPQIADAALVSQMQKASCSAWINSLGDADDLAEDGRIEEAYSPLVERGARVIQSDRPDLLLQYLQKTGRHW